MSNIAFIVDGYTEKLILEKLCPGRPIKRTDLNGKNVSIDAIAKKVASLITLMNNRYYPIIIIIDKEERDQSPNSISEQLINKIKSYGINNELRVGVADKMLENWIIADWDCLSSKKCKTYRN